MMSAMQGRRDEAIRRLDRAADAGRRDWRWDVVEPASADLRGEPAFETVAARMRDEVEAMRRMAQAGPLPRPPSRTAAAWP
jgi:hypothetical protein